MQRISTCTEKRKYICGYDNYCSEKKRELKKKRKKKDKD